MKLLILALCATFAVATLKRCKSGDECDDDQCCLEYAVIFGGICRELSQQDEACTPLVNQKDPDMHRYHCPCDAGLNCKADNEYNVLDHTWKRKAKCVKEGEEEVTTE